MSKKIPKYDDYALIGRTRMDAALALANSNPVLLSRGKIDGSSIIHKFGATVDAATSFIPVTTSGTWQTPTTAQALEIVSDSINDD